MKVFDLSFECNTPEGKDWRIEVTQEGNDCIARMWRDGKRLDVLERFTCLPWDSPKAIMGSALGRIRQSARYEVHRIVDAMSSHLSQVATLEVPA